jgi:methionine biosynthesis protein MetW
MEMVRVGKQAIVGFPNYGHYSIRLKLLAAGRMPRTAELHERWHDSPNIHPFTILDFEDLCWERGITIKRRALLSRHGALPGNFLADWRAVQAVYLIRKDQP